MQLTDDDRKLIGEWITSKCGAMRCFCCGNNRWDLIPIGGMWIGFNTRTTRFHYADGIAVVYIACVSCGHVVPFSAGMIGLKPDPPPPAAVPGDPAAARTPSTATPATTNPEDTP